MKNTRPDPLDDYTAPTTTPNYTPEERDECERVSFQEKLRNITPSFYRLSVGDFMEIKLEGVNVLKVYSEAGLACGTVISSFNGTMVQCLRRKKQFAAEVLSLQGSIKVFSI